MTTPQSKAPLIKPSRRGLLHEKLGVPQGQKIGRAKLESAKNSVSPAMRKEANFALNFSKPQPATGKGESPRSHFGNNEISRSIAQHEREQAKAK